MAEKYTGPVGDRLPDHDEGKPGKSPDMGEKDKVKGYRIFMYLYLVVFIAGCVMLLFWRNYLTYFVLFIGIFGVIMSRSYIKKEMAARQKREELARKREKERNRKR